MEIMINTFIGIDPGKTGGVAIISPSGIKLIDCPVIEIETKVKSKKPNLTLIDQVADKGTVKSKAKPKTKITTKSSPALMASELAQSITSNSTIAIESVHSMPGQGVRSTFDFGMNFGIWLGVIAALNIPMELVTPQEWKKHYGLIGKDKDASRIIAVQLFPQMAMELKLKKYNGRAEALLLAEYLRRKAGG
jgi:crossover junction endodeoxyribonuclease RuvC